MPAPLSPPTPSSTAPVVPVPVAPAPPFSTPTGGVFVPNTWPLLRRLDLAAPPREAALGLAERVLTDLAAVHDAGGWHGALVLAGWGFDADGAFVVRPSFEAPQAVGHPQEADVQAIALILATLLDAQNPGADEPRLRYWLRGAGVVRGPAGALSRDGRVTFRDARSARQALMAIIGRSGVAEPLANWLVRVGGHLPGVRERGVPVGAARPALPGGGAGIALPVAATDDPSRRWVERELTRLRAEEGAKISERMAERVAADKLRMRASRATAPAVVRVSLAPGAARVPPPAPAAVVLAAVVPTAVAAAPVAPAAVMPAAVAPPSIEPTAPSPHSAFRAPGGLQAPTSPRISGIRIRAPGVSEIVEVVPVRSQEPWDAPAPRLNPPMAVAEPGPAEPQAGNVVTPVVAAVEPEPTEAQVEPVAVEPAPADAQVEPVLTPVVAAVEPEPTEAQVEEPGRTPGIAAAAQIASAGQESEPAVAQVASAAQESEPAVAHVAPGLTPSVAAAAHVASAAQDPEPAVSMELAAPAPPASAADVAPVFPAKWPESRLLTEPTPKVSPWTAPEDGTELGLPLVDGIDAYASGVMDLSASGVMDLGASDVMDLGTTRPGATDASIVSVLERSAIVGRIPSIAPVVAPALDPLPLEALRGPVLTPHPDEFEEPGTVFNRPSLEALADRSGPPTWDTAVGVSGNSDRAHEKGPGKWTESGRDAAELASHLPAGPSRPLRLDDQAPRIGMGWIIAGIVGILLVAVLVAFWPA